MREVYKRGGMHPGLKTLWDAAEKEGTLGSLSSRTPLNSSHNAQANTHNITHAYSTIPPGNLAPGPVGSYSLPSTANPFASNAEVRNQVLENRWQPLVPNQTHQVQHNARSTNSTQKASDNLEVTHTNVEESSELSTVTSSEADDDNDPITLV